MMPMMYTFPFSPNWIDGVRYRITYPTKIITAFEGREQRIMMREVPHVEFEGQFDVALASESSWLDSLMWKAQEVGILLPIWLYGVRLELPIASGDTIIPMPASNPYFHQGQTHLTLINAYNQQEYETVIISGYDGSNIELLQPVIRTWPVEDTIMVPSRPARVNPDIQIIKHTSAISTSTIVFKFQETPFIFANDLQYNVGEVYAEDYSGIPTYYGEELCLWESNRRENINVNSKRSVQEFDSTTGPILILSRTKFSATTRDFKFLFDDQMDIMKFVKWLDRRKGRCVPFWVPSGQGDVEIAADIHAGDTRLVVRDMAWESLFEHPGLTADKPHPLRSNLAIYTTNARYFPTRIHRILSRDTLNGTATLEVDAIPEDLPLGDIARTSFLLHMRSDSDTTELYFHDKEIVEVSMKFVETLYDE